MGELNKYRFLLFVSLIIFPAHALDVIISGAHQDFKQRSEIKTSITNGEKIYCGTLSPLTYETEVNISNVIVYIIDRSRYVEIIRNAVREIRLQIAEELKQWNCELVFLGIENFDDDEHHLIGAFMLERIQPHRNQTDQTIIVEVIGENRFDRSYHCHFVDFRRYRENDQICGGTLVARLRAIPHGALRPVESNNKEIKIRGYQPYSCYDKVKEVTWPVRVINDTYLPEVDVSNPKYNFKMRNPDSNICVLVLSGKEYSVVNSLTSQSPERKKMRQIQREMATNYEALFILGAFNFDRSEVYLVTQIILKHSEGFQSSGYNVFACGFGMFNTYYLNWYEDDGRHILQPQSSHVLEIIQALMGEEVKERAINMHYSDNEWTSFRIPIILGNGQYVPVDGYDFTFPWLYQRIAFVVYDSTEMNDPIDYPVVYQSVEELRRSNIHLVLIEAINFGFYDAHIIAEWIERHKGHIDSEQIAVLGGGTFNTIFQSQRTTFNTFFDVGKNELKSIRNAYVKRGNEKRALAAKIDDSCENFEAWSYPMNTVVNGFYETDLIPDKYIFDTANGKKILFIITSANNFQQIAAIQYVGAVISRFREKIKEKYPIRGWSVFLVGLDDFGKRDAHLFAELVKMQTNDGRPLAGFVHVLHYGVRRVSYWYKDTKLFTIYSQARMQTLITSSFREKCRLSDDICSD